MKHLKVDIISVFILTAILSFYYLLFVLGYASFNVLDFHFSFWLLVGYEIGLHKKNILPKTAKIKPNHYPVNSMKKEHIDELFGSLKKDEENE